MFLQRPWSLVLLVALVATACSAPASEGPCTGTTVQLRREGVLTVGMDLTFPPYAFRDPETQEPTGFEVDVADVVATELGLELVIENRASAALVTGVVGQRHDLAASAIRETEELLDQACPSEPYLDADLAITARAGVDPRTPEGAADIGGVTVGVVGGTAADAWARRHLGDTPSVPRYQTTDDLLGALKRGQVDAAIDDEPLILYALKDDPDLRLVDTIALEGGVVFLTSEDNGGLIALVNTVLEDMDTDGRLATLQQEWFGQEL